MHALVVGGTGMLRGVSVELARRGHVVSVIARSRAGLERTERGAAGTAGRVHGVGCDYTDGPGFGAALRGAVAARGPIGLAVCWVHATAPGAVGAVASVMADERAAERPRLLHVVGSAVHDPAARTVGQGALAHVAGIEYARVVLGFVVTPGGSRWLTDGEIVAGVLRAIDAPAADHVVGTTEPWSARP